MFALSIKSEVLVGRPEMAPNYLSINSMSYEIISRNACSIKFSIQCDLYASNGVKFDVPYIDWHSRDVFYLNLSLTFTYTLFYHKFVASVLV